jgi:hypothetical protein
MEVVKRKILLENSIDRNYNSPTYGSITATSFYINVMLTQNIDDMGQFTDVAFIPTVNPVDYTVLSLNLLSSGFTFPFMSGIFPKMLEIDQSYTLRLTGKTVSDYYDYTNKSLTAETESRAGEVRSYSSLEPFKLNFDVNDYTYINFTGGTVNGVDRVTRMGTAFTYVFGADKNDPNIGTNTQKNGLRYIDFGNTGTNVYYTGEGWNQTNTSLSALTKEEYLFGIISKPEVKSDVFIDRGITTVFEKHLKLSEITNLEELNRYGNGYYNLTKI